MEGPAMGSAVVLAALKVAKSECPQLNEMVWSEERPREVRE
jgi:hypothetical protein